MVKLSFVLFLQIYQFKEQLFRYIPKKQYWNGRPLYDVQWVLFSCFFWYVEVLTCPCPPDISKPLLKDFK